MNNFLLNAAYVGLSCWQGGNRTAVGSSVVSSLGIDDSNGPWADSDHELGYHQLSVAYARCYDGLLLGVLAKEGR